MRMKIIYNGKRLVDGKDCGYDIDTDFRQSGLNLMQCIEAGFSVAEISHANRNPHTWHDYSRSTKVELEVMPPDVRTKSEVIADLTERLDIARDGCERARKFVLDMEIKHQERYPVLVYRLDTAITLAKNEVTP